MTIPTLTPVAPLTFDRFRLDADGGDLYGPSGRVPLSPKALAVLHYLARRPGRLVSKSELIDAHWPDVFVADSVIRLCLREIRRAVEDDAKVPRFIETVHRRGYRFIARVSVMPARPFAGPVAASAPDAHPRARDARSGHVNPAGHAPGSQRIDVPAPLDSTRRLATVMCTIWSGAANEPAMARLRSLVATEAARYGGRSVAPVGNCIYAVFDGPAHAVRCASSISSTGRTFNMPVKIGLHTGECDLLTCGAHDLVGEISPRVATLAQAGEVLVSRTVLDLVAGAGLRFRDRGAYQLAAGLGKWPVFALEPDSPSMPSGGNSDDSTMAPLSQDRLRRVPRIAHQVLTA